MNEIRRKNNKGITLIALIIMVVILLILTAVTVDIVVSNDFIEKAKDTVGKANEKIEKQEEDATNIKNAWEELPGEIIKSPTKQNTTIKISVVTSNITENSFRVNAKGTNENNDILTFALIVNGHIQVFNSKTGEEVYWDVTGLTPKTTYGFTVIATDGDGENSVTGSVTTLRTNSAPEITNFYNDSQPGDTTSFSIDVAATDEDYNDLYFTLYGATSENGTYYQCGSDLVTSSYGMCGTNFYIENINGVALTEYTPYWFYYTVSDGKHTVTSDVYSLKTYCPGKKEITEYCYGGFWVTCRTCGGTGEIWDFGTTDLGDEVVYDCEECCPYGVIYGVEKGTKWDPCEHGATGPGQCNEDIGTEIVNCDHGTNGQPHNK